MLFQSNLKLCLERSSVVGTVLQMAERERRKDKVAGQVLELDQD